MSLRDREEYNQYMREWRAKNPERVALHNRNRYDKDPQYYLYSNTRNRCRKEDIPFNLEKEDIIIPDLCPILEVPLVPRTRYAASIDRIDPKAGYIKGNIQVISFKANNMKNDASPEELKKFARWVDDNY